MRATVPAVAVRGLRRQLRDDAGPALARPSSCEPGETVALLGPSGSGKTTLLYALAGFLPVTGGRIELCGRLVASPDRSLPPEERPVAMVFQHYGLWPHLDALDTVAYPLRRAGLGDRGGSSPGARAARAAAHRVAGRPAAGAALGWRAAAGRPGAGAGPATGRLPARRAHRASRRRPQGRPPVRAAGRASTPTVRPRCTPPTMSTRPSPWPTVSSCSARARSSRWARRWRSTSDPWTSGPPRSRARRPSSRAAAEDAASRRRRPTGSTGGSVPGGRAGPAASVARLEAPARPGRPDRGDGRRGPLPWHAHGLPAGHGARRHPRPGARSSAPRRQGTATTCRIERAWRMPARSRLSAVPYPDSR